MSTRSVLFATLLVSALAAAFWLAAPHPAALADNPVNVRPTPTPAGAAAFAADAPEACQPGSPTSPCPDLVVSTIRVLPNPPQVNRAFTVEVTIRNIGPGPVEPTNNFFVDLYVDPSTPPRACQPGVDYWSVQGFELGSGTMTLSRTFDPETDGRFAAFRDVGIVTLWAQVDTAYDQTNNRCGNVVETREDNNLRSTFVDVDTRYEWMQSETEEFLQGFSSALDLSHPLGILQNGTGWFVEPRFPPPEDPNWPQDPLRPWNSETFYNPDYHIVSDNLTDTYPANQLPSWNPADQENIDIQIGYEPNSVFAVWEDARNGDLYDRDIYFSYGYCTDPCDPDNPRLQFLDPAVRVNQDPIGGGHNQLKPQLVVDREARRLFVFWEDNRNGDYDIFYARSTDAFGTTWEEPPGNPVNDKEVDPNADQLNATAGVFYEQRDNCGPTPTNPAPCTHLYVAWEDYRNGNADIFFEWSKDGGTSWLKTRDADPTTVDTNIHVQPDPSGTEVDPGSFDQRNPHLSVERPSGTISYCFDRTNPYTNPPHPYAEDPLPRIFLVWEDERDIVDGDAANIYYTRGEFNFNGFAPAGNCGAYSAKPNLPEYRFEDDHVRANRTISDSDSIQLNPVGVFDPNGFLSYQYGQIALFGDEAYQYTCEVRFRTDEFHILWQDNRDNNFDIWGTNIYDDIDFLAEFALIIDPNEGSEPPPGFDDPTTLTPELARAACLAEEQGGIGENRAPIDPPPAAVQARRNQDPFSPQPPEFYELSFAEPDLEVSNGLTFTPKPLCPTPNEPATTSREPSEQSNPDLATLTTPDPDRILVPYKLDVDEVIRVELLWSAWDDTASLDDVNQDIFLRPVVRYDLERELSVRAPDDIPLALQTVQDNVKNQVALRRRDLYATFNPPNAQQVQPAMSFNLFPDGTFALYTAWSDNRNSNPLIGFEGNKDVFASRLKLDDDLYFELRPTRTGAYVSSVYTTGGPESQWYDIEWHGDITADGLVVFQTRFGMDPARPEPPLENVATNGWTQWTGIGGTGGFYTAPGQHITGPDGDSLPESYYIQYRVIFNPAGGGQQDISCITEVDLNFEADFPTLYLPIVSRR